MFLYRKSKKELDITDALKRKEACITIGGKSVVVRAFKLQQGIEFIAALGNAQELFKLASTDIVAFNKAILAKIGVILAFCLPEYKIDPEQVTLTEFADLLMAVYCVNDVERIYANFMQAMRSIQELTPDLAALRNKYTSISGLK